MAEPTSTFAGKWPLKWAAPDQVTKPDGPGLGQPPAPDHAVVLSSVLSDEVDKAVARLPMPRHGEPSAVAKLLHRLADSLDSDGPRAEELVRLLSARGWAAGTLGDGGARSTDDTSSVERTLLAGPARWAGKDRRYHALLQALERTAQALESLHTDVLAHAGDDDPVPVGTGGCICCARLCRPDPDRGRAGDRLRAGLCPACYRAWRRYVTTAGQDAMVRTDWIRARRGDLTDDHGVLHPEDDSDIDLSVELAEEVGA